MKSSKFTIAFALAGAALGCASGGSKEGAASPARGGTSSSSAPSAAAGAPAPSDDTGLPPATSYDYRPEQPAFDAEAKAPQPPAWFVLASLTDIKPGDIGVQVLATPRAVRAAWSGQSAPQRVEALTRLHEDRRDRWARARALNEPVFLPRSVTQAEVTSPTPPTWATSLAGEERAWSRSSHDQRRTALEQAAVESAGMAERRWAAEHRGEIAQWEREAHARQQDDVSGQKAERDEARRRQILAKLPPGVQDISEARAAGDKGRFVGLFSMIVSEVPGGLLVAIDSVSAPRQDKGRVCLLPERIYVRLEREGIPGALLRDKGAVIVRLMPAADGAPQPSIVELEPMR